MRTALHETVQYFRCYGLANKLVALSSNIDCHIFAMFRILYLTVSALAACCVQILLVTGGILAIEITMRPAWAIIQVIS